ncbi:MAG: autotransporter-associated beta strand repeat-containing protein [Kiritimatiellia bacterium]
MVRWRHKQRIRDYRIWLLRWRSEAEGFLKEFGGSTNRPYLRIEFSGARIKWGGYVDGNWNSTTRNWNVGEIRGTYSNGDHVQFDDSTTRTNILIDSAGVTPASVTVSNAFVQYVFAVGGIEGSGAFTKAGLGDLHLAASNSYEGITLVQGGRLIVSANGVLAAASDESLGGTAGRTRVFQKATLELKGPLKIIDERLTLVGNGLGSGALRSVSGTNKWSGTIRLSADSTIQVDQDSTLLLSALDVGEYALSFVTRGNATVDDSIYGDAGSLTKAGLGELWLTGAKENRYRGTTYRNGGTLILAKATNAIAISSANLEIGSGFLRPAPVRCESNGQIDPGCDVTVREESLFNLNGYNAEISSLTLAGGRVQTGAGILMISGPIHAMGQTAMEITGNIALPTQVPITVAAKATLNITAALTGSGFTKEGQGMLVLSGTNNLTTSVEINEGELHLAGSENGAVLGPGAITVNDKGTLTGSGLITGVLHVNSRGILSPGRDGMPLLTVSNSVAIYDDRVLKLKGGPRWHQPARSRRGWSVYAQ